MIQNLGTRMSDKLSYPKTDSAFYCELFDSKKAHFGKTGAREEHGVFCVIPVRHNNQLSLLAMVRAAPYTPGMALIGGAINDPNVKYPWLSADEQVTAAVESILSAGVRELHEETNVLLDSTYMKGIASVGPIHNKVGGRPGTHVVHFVGYESILNSSELPPVVTSKELEARILISEDPGTLPAPPCGDQLVSCEVFCKQTPFSSHREIVQWFFKTYGGKSSSPRLPFESSAHLRALGDYLSFTGTHRDGL